MSDIIPDQPADVNLHLQVLVRPNSPAPRPIRWHRSGLEVVPPSGRTHRHDGPPRPTGMRAVRRAGEGGRGGTAPASPTRSPATVQTARTCITDGRRCGHYRPGDRVRSQTSSRGVRCRSPPTHTGLRRAPSLRPATRPAPRQVRLPDSVTGKPGALWALWGVRQSYMVTRHVRHQYVRCPLCPSTQSHRCQHTTTVPGPSGCPLGQAVTA